MRNKCKLSFGLFVGGEGVVFGFGWVGGGGRYLVALGIFLLGFFFQYWVEPHCACEISLNSLVSDFPARWQLLV